TEKPIFRGLAGELAACLLLAPEFLGHWREQERRGGENRGRDLLRRWTGVDKHVEVKTTPHCGSDTGYLLLRTRTEKPIASPMTPEDVDDAYYVLMHRVKGLLHRFLGWIDSKTFIKIKEHDPVGRKAQQRHCWGVHHSKLFKGGESLRKGAAACLAQPVD